MEYDHIFALVRWLISEPIFVFLTIFSFVCCLGHCVLAFGLFWWVPGNRSNLSAFVGVVSTPGDFKTPQIRSTHALFRTSSYYFILFRIMCISFGHSLGTISHYFILFRFFMYQKRVPREAT